METIQPEFNGQALYSLYASEQGVNGSNTDTGAENTGHLTLEMRDNPFASLMRRIERLLDSGLKEDRLEAFSLTRSALFDKIFDVKLEKKLTEKMGEIIGLLHEDRVLGNVFTKSVHDIPFENTMNQLLPSKQRPGFQLAA